MIHRALVNPFMFAAPEFSPSQHAERLPSSDAAEFGAASGYPCCHDCGAREPCDRYCPNYNSCGGVEGHAPEGSVSVVVRGLPERRSQDMEAVGWQREAETGWSSEMAMVREQASSCTSQDSDRIAGPSAARGRAGIESGPYETRFQLDEAALMSEIEPVPAFLTRNQNDKLDAFYSDSIQDTRAEEIEELLQLARAEEWPAPPRRMVG